MTGRRTIRAANLVELRGQMKANLPGIPKRVSARENRQREHWIADRLIFGLASHGQIAFPIERRLRDKPDCSFDAGERTIGLEISELVPTALRDAEVLQETVYPNAKVHPSDFPWSKEWTEEELHAFLARGGSVARRPPGWAGDEEERALAGAANERLSRKTKQLNGEGFEKFDENWLGLYASYPPPHLHCEALATELCDPRPVGDQPVRFNRLLLLAGDRFVMAPYVVLEAPTPWT